MGPLKVQHLKQYSINVQANYLKGNILNYGKYKNSNH